MNEASSSSSFNKSKINSKNKSASFHIYADLCEVRNFSMVKANYSKNLDYIYFEAKQSSDETSNKKLNSETEFILPIDENDPNFDVTLIENIIEDINLAKNTTDDSLIKKIKLGIVSIDYTTVYYDFTMGIDSPFQVDDLLKNK